MHIIWPIRHAVFYFLLLSFVFSSANVAGASSGWQQGFDFRFTPKFVSDPPGATYVLPTTAYPTTVDGVTFGWTAPTGGSNQTPKYDPRLDGINYLANGSPLAFYVDLPSPGTYSIALAMGSAMGSTCLSVTCQVQFLDGSTVLATVNGTGLNTGYFLDGQGNKWFATDWPTNNVSQQVTLAGTRLTVLVGTTQKGGNTPIAYLGLTQVSTPNFAVSASPTSLSVQQGNQGTSIITTAISSGFNSSINLSASGVPAGTSVTFNPQTIPAPGSGSSSMTITVGSTTPIGTYPITVTGNGGGIQQNTTVTLTVVAPPSFTISASPPSLSIVQGNQGTSSITTTISNGFNSDISLSASGLPTGTTVTLNPQTIPAPGSGSSTMTITVDISTPVGTYPITVTGNGGGTQQNTTVTLTVTAFVPPDFTIALSPSSITVQQGFASVSTVTTTILGQFNSPVDLSVSGMPTGTTVSFNPQTIPAPGAGTSAMTITVGNNTPLGTYPITVTGNGGGNQHR